MAYRFNVHVVFCLLFFFSVVKPQVSFEYVNIAMVVVTLLSILILSTYILLKQGHYKRILKEYPVELALIASYPIVSLIAMSGNMDAFFGYMFNVVFFGLSPIAIWCSMPLIWLIMRHGNNDNPRFYWLFGWGVFVFMAVVGFWQAIDFESSKLLTQFFVASDRLEPNVNSVTRVATDFGVLMALAVVGCFIVITNGKDIENRNVYLAMALLFFIAGLLSGSRNFLITLVAGCLLLNLGKIKNNFTKVFLVALLFFVLLNIVSFASDNVMQRFSVFFPYMAKIQSCETITWRDLFFLFQSGEVYTSGRGMIWSEVVSTWLDGRFWFGYSTRGFGIHLHQLELASIQTNGHNFIMQSIIDGGIIGLAIITSLVYRIYRRTLASGEWPIFLTFLASMMVDYYLDHSLPWMLCAGWLLNIYRFGSKPI